MKYAVFAALAALAALAGGAAAANKPAPGAQEVLDNLPPCVKDCVKEAMTKVGCESGDIGCGCNKLDSIFPLTANCVLPLLGEEGCPATVIETGMELPEKICIIEEGTAGEDPPASTEPTEYAPTTVSSSSAEAAPTTTAAPSSSSEYSHPTAASSSSLNPTTTIAIPGTTSAASKDCDDEYTPTAPTSMHQPSTVSPDAAPAMTGFAWAGAAVAVVALAM